MLQGLEHGGLEMMLAQLLEGLDHSRYAAEIVCYDCLGPLEQRLSSRGIRSTLLPRRPGIDIGYILRLAQHLAHIKPDILHLHNPTAFFYGSLAGRLARIPTILYTDHGRDFTSSRHNRFLHPILARLVDRVIAVSEAGMRNLREEGVPASRLMTIHNGIADRYSQVDARRRQTRQELGLKHDLPVVGIVARLDGIKNHALLLHAMVAVLKARPEVVLLVIGDGPLRSELASLATQLEIESAVRFLGNRDDIPELLGALDMLVLCSHSESLSITLVEGCAAGRPLIATDVGGNAEVIEHEVNGLLVPPADEAALSAAILRVMEQPLLAQTMGQAGRQKYCKEFTLDTMASRYLGVYEDCLTRKYRD